MRKIYLGERHENVVEVRCVEESLLGVFTRWFFELMLLLNDFFIVSFTGPRQHW